MTSSITPRLRAQRTVVRPDRFGFFRLDPFPAFWTVFLAAVIGVVSPCRSQTGAGTALFFDGADDFVSISNSPALNVFPLTVMGWFRSSDFGLDRGLVNKYSANSFNGYQVYLHQGRLRAWYFRDGLNYVWDGGRGLDGGFVLGIWQHFAFTVDASGGKLFLNGILRSSLPWTGTPGATTTPLDMRFGRYDQNFLNGALDEISVWNVALTSNAILSAMSRRIESNEAGLLGYWRFGEGAGNLTVDAASAAGSAGNNAGTLFGGVTWTPSGAGVGPFVNTRGISGQTLAGEVNLNGEVNPLGRSTTAWFEWGTNTGYGNQTTPFNAGSGSNYLTAAALISGLEPGLTYHYRFVATNLNGRANGEDRSFVQPEHPPTAGGPPLRSTFYDGGFASYAGYDARPDWDTTVPMTIEAWVYRQDAGRFETIVSHDAPGSYWLGFAPALRFYRGTNFAEVPAVVPARKWTHVAVSYDGAVARFYLNGEYLGARGLSHTGAGKVRALLIGHNDSHNEDIGPVDRFLGNLDEIRIWSVARSGEQIARTMYRELRDEPGLAAVFPRGGRIEEIHGLVGSAGSGTSEQVFGMLPRDLVVPLAAIPPTADGRVDLPSEYLGAEQLVLRYPDDPLAADAVAYFVHTDDDLFVGVRGPRYNAEGWAYTNTWIGLFIDPAHERPPLAGLTQAVVQAFQDVSFPGARLLNGDGGGSYFFCTTFNPLTGLHPCTPASFWDVGRFYCDGEFTPLCTEFRVSRSLLGSFEEVDGVGLGHFNFTPFGDQAFAPEEGFPDSPATWLTMSYGASGATLPRVRWSGRVRAGLAPTSPPLPGYRVSLIAGGVGYSRFTDFQGRFDFDVPVPTGQTIFAQAELEAFGRYTLPIVSAGGLQPQFVLTNRVLFAGLPSDASGVIQLANVEFLVQRPLDASAIFSATPTNPVCGTSVRVGVPGGPGEIVTLFGVNLHAEMEFYLAPHTTAFNSPAAWTLLKAPVVELSPDGTWVKVQTPFVPEQVREHTNGFFIQSFQSQWRWVSRDFWFRLGAPEFSHFGTFPIRRPPYPLMHGFHFKNDQTFPGLEEFLAAYGNNAYLCVGAFDHCATHVPDPLYWILWYPVHFIVIGMSGGSCVGMSGASMQLFNGSILPTQYDSQAITAMGINDPGLPGEWDTSNTGGIYTRPPIPKDIWARIRMNHGAQTSAEYMIHVISQLDVGVFSPEFGGDPNARLIDLRAHPTLNAICMVQGFGGGHCVMPYRVEDNFGGDPNHSRIWVYDNNTPCAMGALAHDPCVTGQFIDIDRAANEYTFPSLGWTGTALFTVPLSHYDGERTAPGLVDFVEALATFLVVVAGGADAHYTTAGGGEWGWRGDGTFVNNLPGIHAITPLGSPTNYTRSIPVLLPLSNGVPVVNVHMRSTNSHIFHVAAGGTMLQLDMARGAPGTSNRIELGAVSNQLSSFRFIPQTAMSNFIPRIGLQLGSNACAAFQWIGLDSQGGLAQEFRAVKSRRSVEYRNQSGKPTQHFVRIDAVDGTSTNNTSAVFGPFTVPSGAVHGVVIHDWPRVREVRSEMDFDGDGTPDQVTTVTGMPLDSDGDGLPDDWEVLHQLNPQSAQGDDGAEGDPDRDGISNHDEYLSGTDPRRPDAPLRLTATLLSGNLVRLTWPAEPGQSYELLYADAVDEPFQPLSDEGFPRIATGTEEHYDAPVVPGDGARFYRLRRIP